MTTPDIIRAHRHSSNHREEVLECTVCGCFYCCHIFSPSEIKDWIDNREDWTAHNKEIGQTALCPQCDIDSIIGVESGYPVTVDFLAAMMAHWF